MERAYCSRIDEFMNMRRSIYFSVVSSLVLVFGLAVMAQEGGRTDAKSAVKIFEIGRGTDKVITRKLNDSWKSYNPEIEFYIINYGSEKEIARRERLIRNTMNFRHEDPARITFVRGGIGGGQKTVIWKIPPGAEYPDP